MAFRNPAIPNIRERSALQLSMHGNWVLPSDLCPAGERMIANLIRKGWIERRIGPTAREQLRITDAGRAALTVKIPEAIRRLVEIQGCGRNEHRPRAREPT